MSAPKHVRLTANTVAVIALDDDWDCAEIVYTSHAALDTAATVWARADGIAPVAEAEGTYCLVPVIGAKVRVRVPTSGTTRVRLVSTAAVRVAIHPVL